MGNPRLHYLIKQYVKNACSRDEFDELMDFVSKNPDHPQLHEALHNEWVDNTNANAPLLDWERLRRSLEFTIHKHEPKRGGIFLKVAAAVAILLVSSFSILYLSKSDKKSSVLSPPSILTIKKTTGGEGRVVILPDGTKVWINKNSELLYPSEFTGPTRQVSLNGEAYFDVTPNPSKPFIVLVSTLSIKVLGTAFNVKSYMGDKTIETTLIHGKVSINKADNVKGESLILKPNERAIFSKAANSINVEQVLTEKITSWRSDKLVFDEMPFVEVIDQLERWYNVKIFTEDGSELSCKLNAELEREPLTEVMELLATTHNISYKIDGDKVYIKGSLCSN